MRWLLYGLQEGNEHGLKIDLIQRKTLGVLLKQSYTAFGHDSATLYTFVSSKKGNSFDESRVHPGQKKVDEHERIAYLENVIGNWSPS